MNPADKNTFPAHGFCFQLVTAITARAWVGYPQCRDPTWPKVLSSALQDFMGIAATLRPYPEFLRPLVRPWVAPKSDKATLFADANNFLRPIVQERHKGDSSNIDLLQFFINASKGQDFKSQDITPISQRLLLLAAAAVGYHA